MPKFKNSNATFWVIFKHCVSVSYFTYGTYLIVYLGKESDYLKRTEFVTKNEQWNGPDLPLELRGHCMVKVDEDSILVTGGNALDSHR